MSGDVKLDGAEASTDALVSMASVGVTVAPALPAGGLYAVTDGTQVNLAGVVHEGGSTVDVDPATATAWLLAGYLEPLPKMPARRKASPAP